MKVVSTGTHSRQNGQDWWAYLHENGSVQVKRYFGDRRDIWEAKESPFCCQTTGPFLAKGRDDAIEIAEARFGL